MWIKEQGSRQGDEQVRTRQRSMWVHLGDSDNEIKSKPVKWPLEVAGFSNNWRKE